MDDHEREIERLKSGQFTLEEFHNLCHDKFPCSRDEFDQGCIEYQRKLFGPRPKPAWITIVNLWTIAAGVLLLVVIVGSALYGLPMDLSAVRVAGAWLAGWGIASGVAGLIDDE